MKNGADWQSADCLSVPSNTKSELLPVQSAFIHMRIRTLWISNKHRKKEEENVSKEFSGLAKTFRFYYS